MTGEQRRRASLSQIFRGNNHFIIDLVCPDNTSISRSYSIRDTIEDVLQQSCKQLGIKKTDIFSIAIHEYNEYRFLSQKKCLYKFLPGEAIVPFEQIPILHDDNTKGFALNNNSMKSCRLYLRVRIFPPNIDNLFSQALYYFTEQIRLDAIKYQNWLQFPGLTDIFHEIGAIGIWLKFGESSIELISKQNIQLHYYLPISEQNETTWAILKTKVEKLNDDYGYKGFTLEDKREECLISKLPLTKSDSEQSTTRTRKITVTEDDVIIVDDRDTIMLSLVSEAKKLPFYGTHFYHVSMTADKEGEGSKSQTNCKLGIGPSGICVVVSPFYTTWTERVNIKWNSVGEMKYEKNMLHVNENALPRGGTSLLHSFVCIDEKEAKYMFNQLKEMHFFHLSNSSDRRVERSKRNSIGVMNMLTVANENKQQQNNMLSVTPAPRRTLSFNLLLLPRKFSN